MVNFEEPYRMIDCLCIMYGTLSKWTPVTFGVLVTPISQYANEAPVLWYTAVYINLCHLSRLKILLNGISSVIAY